MPMNAGELVQRSGLEGIGPPAKQIWIRGELKIVSGLGSVLQTHLDSYSVHRKTASDGSRLSNEFIHSNLWTQKKKWCLFGRRVNN